MVSKLFVVMGGTGKIGHVLCDSLLKNGHRVKALGRDQKKLGVLKNLGAEVVTIDDFGHLASLTSAFKGADGVFSFIPPGYSVDNYAAFQDTVSDAICKALQKNKIRYAINLSSLGANHSNGTGPIRGLYRHEQLLRTVSGLNVIHLRPSYFMENLFTSIPLIHQARMLGTPLRGDLPMPLIATWDIGLKAAELMQLMNVSGHAVFEFVGPRAVTMKETTKLLGNAIGKMNLEYVQIPYTDAEKGMVAAGIKPSTAALLIEMYKAINSGCCQPTQEITPANQGKITIEQFAESFAKAYKQYAESEPTKEKT